MLNHQHRLHRRLRLQTASAAFICGSTAGNRGNAEVHSTIAVNRRADTPDFQRWRGVQLHNLGTSSMPSEKGAKLPLKPDTATHMVPLRVVAKETV